MNNNQNNLMITVKKADGTFQKVPLSDLKKNASIAVAQPPSLPKKGQPDKKEDLDLNSVPFTRKSEGDSEKFIKKQPQKTVSDRSYIMGYEDKKEAVKNDIKAVEVVKDRFDNFEQNEKADTKATVVLTEGKPAYSADRNLDPSVPAYSVGKPQDDNNVNVILSKAKNLDPSVPQDDKKNQDSKMKKIKIFSDLSPKENIPKHTFFANKKEKENLNLPQLSSQDFKSPLEENLPEVYHEPGELANITPFNSFVHKKTTAQKVVNVENIVDKPVPKNIFSPAKTLPPEKIGLANTISHKTPMHDIVVKPKVYGPIEEIQNFTLTDLRRLSSDTGEAVNRLQQKFINIKEESIILYFKAVDVWIKSPLYKDYISKIGQALSQGFSLGKLVGNNGDISLTEIKALAIMNKTLEI